MNLYLSSYQIGDRGGELAALLGGRKRMAVIRNALDFSTDAERLRFGLERELAELASVGISGTEIDLRKYFGAEDATPAPPPPSQEITMAQGPDPNRDFDTDREITRAELEQGGALGDQKSSRLGLSSWAIVLVAVVFAVFIIALMR